jgi:hypothetical protein
MPRSAKRAMVFPIIRAQPDCLFKVIESFVSAAKIKQYVSHVAMNFVIARFGIEGKLQLNEGLFVTTRSAIDPGERTTHFSLVRSESQGFG